MDTVFAIDSLDVFENVASTMLNNLNYSNCGNINKIDINSMEAAKQEIKTILSENQFDINKIAEVISKRGWGQDKLSIFLNLIEQKKSALMYSEISYHISMYGETVTDFDWLLKIVLGSSDLKTLRYPLLQLIFSTVNCHAEQKHLVFDVCKDIIGKLINLLESYTE